MYLSNRDIRWAIDCGKLVVRPRPEEFREGYDETSIDLHLGQVNEARIWDIEKLERAQNARGAKGPEVHIGKFNLGEFAEQYLMAPPAESRDPVERQRQLVCLRGDQVIVKPRGFLLWTTKEWVGTPEENPELICFADGKSTRARTGIVVHLTAPTIHSGWQGYITLEIANLGPFHFVLEEDDVIAQLTVATISSSPDLALKKRPSATAGQKHVSGKARRTSSRARKPRKQS
jgi:dCTP deaminase